MNSSSSGESPLCWRSTNWGISFGDLDNSSDFQETVDPSPISTPSPATDSGYFSHAEVWALEAAEEEEEERAKALQRRGPEAPALPMIPTCALASRTGSHPSVGESHRDPSVTMKRRRPHPPTGEPVEVQEAMKEDPSILTTYSGIPIRYSGQVIENPSLLSENDFKAMAREVGDVPPLPKCGDRYSTPAFRKALTDGLISRVVGLPYPIKDGEEHLVLERAMDQIMWGVHEAMTALCSLREHMSQSSSAAEEIADLRRQIEEYKGKLTKAKCDVLQSQAALAAKDKDIAILRASVKEEKAKVKEQQKKFDADLTKECDLRFEDGMYHMVRGLRVKYPKYEVTDDEFYHIMISNPYSSSYMALHPTVPYREADLSKRRAGKLKIPTELPDTVPGNLRERVHTYYQRKSSALIASGSAPSGSAPQWLPL